MRPLKAAALLLALAGCAGPALAPGFQLDAAPVTLRVAVAPARELAAASRAWHADDVYEYDLALKTYDAAQGAFVELPTPRATVLPQKPEAASLAEFGGLTAGQRYQVAVTARGNAGGTAADEVLNAAPATAVFDLSATAPVLQQTVHVALDALPFAVALQLPSNLTAPGSVPAWATSLDATLADAAASATPLVRATYTPGQAMRFANVKGDHAYALAIAIHSPTGQTTVRLPSYVVARADGVPDTLAPAFPPFVPPTGTLLHSYTVATAAVGSFGVALDAADRLWVTLQHGSAVANLDATGTPLIPNVAVGSTPRGVAVDKATGDVWVAEAAIGGKVDKIVGGVRVGRFGAGFYPDAVAIDPQHRVWVTDAALGQVHVLTPAGVEVAGAPYGVGSQPATLAIDPASGDCWVSNSGSATVSKISAAGVVSGPYATGTTPSGVGIAPDHTIWVACNGDSTLRHFKPDGTAAGPNVSVPGGPSVLAIDPADGDMWVSVLSGNLIAKLTPAGTLINRYPAGTFPAGLAVDTRHHLWITGNGLLTEMAP